MRPRVRRTIPYILPRRANESPPTSPQFLVRATHSALYFFALRRAAARETTHRTIAIPNARYIAALFARANSDAFDARIRRHAIRT